MKKLFVPVFLCALIVVGAASAATFADMKTGLATAREKLLALFDAKDKAAQDALVAEIATATAGVDAALGENEKTAAGAVKEKLDVFKTTYVEFKKTRDEQIVPAILAGKGEEVRPVAKGVQAERFQKMNALLDELVAGAK